jgi:hypothetical protein
MSHSLRIAVAFASLTAFTTGSSTLVAQQAGGHTVQAEVVFVGTYGYGVTPTAINDKGVATGAVLADSSMNTFLWSERHGFRTVWAGGYANDINNRGDLAGIWSTCFGSDCPYYGFSLTTKDGFQDLGDFLPNSLNNRGDIAGQCWTPGLPCAFRHGVLERGDIPGMLSGINDRGDAVGPGVLWPNQSSPQAVDGQWYAINDRGVLAGAVALQGLLIPAIQQDGRIVTIPATTLRIGYADSINERGEVVGILDERAFYWNTESGQVIVFDDVVPGQYVSAARDINNRGEVVGYAQGPGRFEMVVWCVR